MRYLFIAEKPSLMREAKACYQNHIAEIKKVVGNVDFIALAGHACRNGEPNEYEEWNDKWENITYPMIPAQWIIKPIQDKRSILKKIKKVAPSYDGIIVGTDSDTEGYGIYYLIEHYLGLQHMKALRFMEHSLTDKELLHSFLTMTDYHEDPVHIRYTQSFLLRSRADWLYGMNATRLATSHTGKLLTIGRVKAPTLKLVYDNSMAIENFKPETYYQLQVDYGAFKAVMIGEDGKSFKFKNPDYNFQVPLEGIVFDKKETVTKTHAPELYNLPSLQVDAGQMLGYTPAQTLELVQSLYEKHKVISYPRTQCRYVSSEKAKEFPDMLQKLTVFQEFVPYLNTIHDITHVYKDKHVVNDAEVAKESHDALLPTSKKPVLSEMTKDEVAICRLIYTRFLAQFLPPLTESKTRMDMKHGNAVFRVNGKVVVDLGWRALYGALKDNMLPQLAVNSPIAAKKMEYAKQVTKPPRRLTQASLIEAMEKIANHVEDEELRASLANSNGIGTPATRDTVITDLLARGYMVDKKGLYITQDGKTYIETLKDIDLISPVFAAKLDYEIKKIQRGEAKYQDVYQMMLQNLKTTCLQLEKLETRETSYVCPHCKSTMSNGRWESICQNCGFKLPRRILNISLDEEMIQSLLSGQKTKLLTFKKKDGSTFQAKLQMTKEGIGFDFSSGLFCPFCGKEVKLNQYGCFCDCGLKIFRSLAGKTLTDKDFELLMKKRKTPVKKNFKKKNGNTFDAGLQLTDEKTIQFYFQ